MRIGKSLTGKRFGRLLVLQESVPWIGKHGRRRQYVCLCDCGKKCSVPAHRLKGGQTKSCGCLAVDRTRESHTKHGYSPKSGPSSEYSTWQSMKNRCYNPSNQAYGYYGGRGITVCERWRKSFLNFLMDMGNKPRGSTLERVNNNGDYSKCNCRWVDRKAQANNRRSNRAITFSGITKTLSQWASHVGIRKGTIRQRIIYGWPLEIALFKRPRKHIRIQ